MTEAWENIAVEHLRRMRQTLDDIRKDIRELKVRTSATEMQLSALNNCMDRFDERLAHIERRLDLVDVH